MTDSIKYANVIGMTREEATRITGLIIRARTVNGEAVIGTQDYRVDRLNVHIKDGKIVSVAGLG